jgi:hypothetical protein
LHTTLQAPAVPVCVSIVQTSLSTQVLGQGVTDPASHVSLLSITPLPQLGEQSLSVLLLQPLGQQPSPLAQLAMETWPQDALQVAALPVSVSAVHALLSSQPLGQGMADPLSHVSPASTTPLPQLEEQSLSMFLLQPAGQHESPLVHWVILEWLHATLQLAMLPVCESDVQALPSSQLIVLHRGVAGATSQVSPDSIAPLPHATEQSVSVLWLQPAGQQPSPFAHCVMFCELHEMLQVSALPV